jgi:hypothetical protein
MGLRVERTNPKEKHMKLCLILTLLLVSVNASAKKKDNGRPRCATTYSIVQEDQLGNVRQGIAPKDLKWADKDLEKKYPDVCYAAPNPSVKTVFVITTIPGTYRGTQVRTSSETNTEPTHGNVTDAEGQQIGTYSGTATTTSTSSTAVPYSFEYGKYMLTVEIFGADGHPVVRRRFQQDGIYSTYAGIPLGGRGHHPAKALIEDAVKWIHAGGLDDPFQSAR